MKRIRAIPRHALAVLSTCLAIVRAMPAWSQEGDSSAWLPVLAGPSVVCPGTTNTFYVTDEIADERTTYHWGLSNNTAGAVLLGGGAEPLIRLTAAGPGVCSLVVTVAVANVERVRVIDVKIAESVTTTPLTNQTTCFGATVTFSTTPSGSGPFSFIWRKGTNAIAAATNHFLTLNEAKPSDSGEYCVEVTGLCGSATQCASLIVDPPPAIDCPRRLTMECLSEVPAPDPGSVACGTAVSGPIRVAHAGDEFATNGCEIVITRTYRGTDACGNESFCRQTITVVDTTPPLINSVPDRIVECDANWGFETPSAYDSCEGTNVVVEIVATVTNNLCGRTFTATRVWQATDRCGNCVRTNQTIQVLDTTAPTLTCATNRTVEWGAAWEFDPPVARDQCDGTNVTITVVATVTNITRGSVFTAIRTWSATDACGNEATCAQRIIVVDTVPPRIVCPPDMTISEDPPGSRRATANYPAPLATDDCDPAPVVVCDVPAGSILPLGNTVVTCVAIDASGNSNSCSFVVRVIPGTIFAGSTADSGPGTLRQALLDANAAPGTNVITFAFSGPSPFIIHLLSPLPPITDPVVIDGRSQLEFRGQPIIELDGSNAVAAGNADAPDGLVITSGDSTVRGLVLNGFAKGIRIEGHGGNVIQGNFIGTDVTGTLATGNSGDGICVASPRNLIGGSLPAARNVISGNRRSGIRIEGTNAAGNIVRGNFIGPAADGISALGNGLDGVTLGFGATGNVVGEIAAGAGNFIAFNGRDGVSLDPSAGPGNAIRGNAITSNGRLGIDLGADGINENDPGDPDTGPNNQQNFPVLLSVSSDGQTTLVRGSLNSAPDAAYEIDFFAITPADDAGRGASQTFLGAATVITDGNGDQSFAVTLPAPVGAGQLVTATATDSSNNTSEFAPPVAVGGPPVILAQPEGVRAPPGAPVMFCVTAMGSPPLTYQWRRNGANIPGATNSCLSIPGVQLEDGGAYTVIVANEFGAITSDAALLVLVLPARPVGDDFVDRVPLLMTNGVTTGDNLSATKEPGEPDHVGKPGGRSVWYTWTAPATGIATFGTTGSTFDTLLAVYSGSTLSNLAIVATDEDRGGFYTSGVRFNVSAGASYVVAIDGFGGSGGNFVLDWSFEATTNLLPLITTQPSDRTVAPGVTVIFTVDAQGDTNQDCGIVWYLWHDDETGHSYYSTQAFLTYQWFFNGIAIRGATKPTLTVTNVQPEDVGTYTVQVKSGQRIVETLPARLQINLTGVEVQNVQAQDKFLDAVFSEPLRLGASGISVPAGSAPESAGFQAAAAVVRGYTGTQVFNTAGASTEAGEEPICGVVGGASEWISFISAETGTLFLNTDGSSYDTVVAILTRALNSPMLVQLGCDNNSGLDMKDSALVVPVEAGKTNFIVIDGVNGATGILRLNYSLVTPTLLTPLGVAPNGSSRIRVRGRPDLRFTIQRSENLQTWSSLLTTNAPSGVFDFIDTTSGNMPGRFYRALLLP